MCAAHAPIVSAIRANHHAARSNQNEAAVAADRPIPPTCRFEEAAVANDDDDGGDTVGSVSSRASVGVVLTNLSARMWDIPSLCPTQEAVIAEIMHGRCRGKFLLVHRTGGDKSHILRMLGLLVAGVVVVISSLLTLCADQIRKIGEASQKYASLKNALECDPR